MKKEPKKDKRKKELHELIGVKRILDNMRKGEALQLTFLSNAESGSTQPRYSLTPSGKTVPSVDAKKQLMQGLWHQKTEVFLMTRHKHG